jgi:pyrroline-5-carboxylate reductase
VIGVVRGPDAGPAAVGIWPRGADVSADVIWSPPVLLEEAAGRCSVLILTLPEEESRIALSRLCGHMRPESARISACPTVSLGLMRSLAGAGPTLFRAISPPGARPGEGVAALAPEPGTDAEIVQQVLRSFTWLDAVEVTGEETLDAVAALALGAAGLVSVALDGLEKGAVREGLPRETARSFVHQTALATALLLSGHSGSPADLKDQVASPGGTTIAALATLEDAAVRGAFIRAVQRSALDVCARRDAAGLGMIE